MNGVEKTLLDSPSRAMVQRWYEVPLLRHLDGAHVLEVGCGRGVGTQLLIDRMGAAFVHAIDLDPDQVARAQVRLVGYGPDRVLVETGDATALPVADASVDAVVGFAVPHHVPVWPDAELDRHDPHQAANPDSGRPSTGRETP